MTVPVLLLVLIVVLALSVGAALGGVFVHGRMAVPLATRTAQCEALQQRLTESLQDAAGDRDTLAALTPLRDTLIRVERQVGVLERDRVEQFGELGERLAEVSSSTAALRQQTSHLAGSLNASSIRGTWGENQLRRVLEHSGMLARCDFEEQVRAVTTADAQVRPDVVVRLPGERSLVIDAKAPLSAFLSAQADGVDQARHAELMKRHASALRNHVQALASKSYWAAFSDSPEMVVCFIPADAILAAALAADPSLFDEAQSARVVLASPGTLLALLRSVAFAWQQDGLASNARELLALGTELHSRIGTLASHLTRMGSSLRKSVDSYNTMVGALESRVLVTARRLHDLDLAGSAPTPVSALDVSPRPLTATELLEALDPSREDLLDERGDKATPATGSAARPSAEAS